jgi:hypothetical protein
VERDKQWWRWSSPPVRPSSVTEQGDLFKARREWVLTRLIGGVVVDIQPFPKVALSNHNSSFLRLPLEPPELSLEAVDILSHCYTCKKSTLLPVDTESSPPPPSSSGPLISQTIPILADPDIRHPRQQSRWSQGLKCEVCDLVSFCSNLCFAASIAHHHLCVPKPFG